MRRLLLALAAAATLAGGTLPVATPAHASHVECSQHCGEKAADHCDDIDSWGCMWFIIGCLGGCALS